MTDTDDVKYDLYCHSGLNSDTVCCWERSHAAACAEHGQQMAPDRSSAALQKKDVARKCIRWMRIKRDDSAARDPQALRTSC